MTGRLAGKVALITGTASGIGRSLALAFAAEGARVAGVDLRGDGAEATASAIAARGGVALGLAADVTDPEQVRRAVRRTEETLGPIDVLVNNAGVTDSEHRQVSDLPLAVWERILRVNVTGAFLCAQAVIPSMRARRRGNIINVTSLLGWWRMGQAGDAAYCASKAALEALTDVLAKELRPHRINVNSLCPFTKLDTGFFAHLPAEARTDLDPPEVLHEPAIFLAALAPGTLTGLSLSDLWWRTVPAYRADLETAHAVYARGETQPSTTPPSSSTQERP
ncbi:MAG: SDR family oxidoreductase [Armatimonadota bacterium]|nr:SDR family oxidoreductase [Armatimonadota bacterium]MDR7447776.1 SDR family oxidoreductase [Armatimonadota bacterium]MDR7458555.1 SDR family oxidoreductase [Armatimonadota bacterium]MDR7479890.1 SDR family oxidoreductase [Armatimonadota bacterium]MDR7487762.1 SDR family oxidoreductase [Armatimonadota bacterium]